MHVSDSMKRQVVSIGTSASVAQAMALFVARRVGTLPVVDDANRLVGVLQLRDLLNLVLPGFEQLLENSDFVHDLGALENHRPTAEETAVEVRELMQPPVSVEASSGLLRAATLLGCHGLVDVPVVDASGRLVGIVSFVDIGVALLAGWQEPEPGGPRG